MDIMEIYLLELGGLLAGRSASLGLILGVDASDDVGGDADSLVLLGDLLPIDADNLRLRRRFRALASTHSLERKTT